MISITELVLFGLATFRIAHLCVWEDGPGKIFFKIRYAVRATNWDPSESKGFIAGVFSCVWCMSVWVGFFFTAINIYDRVIASWVAFPFALSAIGILLREHLDKE